MSDKERKEAEEAVSLFEASMRESFFKDKGKVDKELRLSINRTSGKKIILTLEVHCGEVLLNAEVTEADFSRMILSGALVKVVPIIN